MLIETPSTGRGALDLLVVGGMTIDRFDDGSSAPGGSVVHIARAAAGRGLRIGLITAAGAEPEARSAVDELRRLADPVECQPARTTITFRHRESAAGRRLWLERGGQPVRLSAEAPDRIQARAVLYAPVAGEVSATALRARAEGWAGGAILQGWLRSTRAGEEVKPLPLSTLTDEVLAALAALDLLVASRQDLAAEAPNPAGQLSAMRRTFGSLPTLVLTDGSAGAWIGPGGEHPQLEPWRIPVRRVVDGAPTVGAGDIFAAFLLAGRWERRPSRDFLTGRAQRAMRVVADVLEQRMRA